MKRNKRMKKKGLTGFILAGFLASMLITWKTEGKTAEITIHSIPPKAEVLVNGEKRGTTPLLLVLPTGIFLEIKLAYNGLEPYMLSYAADKNDVIIVDLEKRELLDEQTYWHRIAQKTVIDIPTETPSPTAAPVEAKRPAPPQGITEPKILDVPEPGQVPDELVTVDVSGSAVYRAHINHRGQVMETVPVKSSSSEVLDTFIIKWINKWRFSPAEANGFPVPADKHITIYFDLKKKLLKIQDFPKPNEFSPVSRKVGKAEAASSTGSQKDSASSISNAEELPVTEVSNQASPLPVASPVLPTPEPAEQKKQKRPACSDSSAVDQKPTILQRPNIGSIPIEIQNLKLKGTALFELLIGDDGKVISVSVIESSGEDMLDTWLKKILSTAEWNPAMKNGKPVTCRRRTPVSFHTLACRIEFPDLFK